MFNGANLHLIAHENGATNRITNIFRDSFNGRLSFKVGSANDYAMINGSWICFQPDIQACV